MKVAFYTLGCKVNQYETEAMMELFKTNEYEIVPFEVFADVYVINTCTVTNLGDRKSRQMIRRAKKNNSESVVAVVGCYVQVAPEEVKSIEGVNIIVGTDQRSRIVEMIETYKRESSSMEIVENIMNVHDFEEMTIGQMEGRTRAYLKIQEGCNQFCSYCIIPYARGPIRSRQPENILKEVEKLVVNGFKEIVLTGIHVASYGKDLDNMNLLKVIEMVHQVEGLERIRLSSIEPRVITEAFVQRIARLPKVCPHFHLSLQSGSDSVLKRMNRKYTTSQYKEAVQLLRRELKNMAITTDIIVGFPGETEKEFEETYEFVKDLQFAQIHVFKYSPRKGTPAAKMNNQVDGKIKEIRSKKMIALGEKMQKRFLEQYMDQTVEVLFEQMTSNEGYYEGYYEGYTPNYMKVIGFSNEDLKNVITQVKICDMGKDFLKGEIH